MTKLGGRAGALTLLSSAILAGQPPPVSAPVFEVASTKVSRIWQAGGEGSRRENISASPGSVTMRNVTLSSCLQWAYDVGFYRIAGPAWLNEDRYEILAKADGPASIGRLRAMLQALLAQRFQLKLHREPRQFPVYALVVARNGSKLRPSQTGGDAAMWVSGGNFVFRNISMPAFADKLSNLRGVDRPVVDATGIVGTFDITLESAASAILDNNGPSVFTLIQEQLGLKPEPRKASMDMLVVDHADRIPTED